MMVLHIETSKIAGDSSEYFENVCESLGDSLLNYEFSNNIIILLIEEDTPRSRGIAKQYGMSVLSA